MHILLTNVHLDCRGGGCSIDRNASRDESVETGDESVETGDESIEAGEKHNNHAIIYGTWCCFVSSIANHKPQLGHLCI